MRQNNTENLVKASLLTALSIVLTRFFSFILPIGNLPTIRIGFGGIPIKLAGILLGPGYGALCGFVSDILGVLINPQGTFHPGFTLTSTLAGFIPGYLFYIFKKKEGWLNFLNIFVASLVEGILCSALLNSLWLSQMFGKAFWIILTPRLLSTGINIVLHSVIIYAILDRLRSFLGNDA